MNCGTCGGPVTQTNNPGPGGDVTERYECPNGHLGRIDWADGRIDSVRGLAGV